VRELEANGVDVVAPGSEKYEAAVKPFNHRVSWRPLAVAVPSTAEEVAMVVRCAGKHNVKIATKSGGHSYAGYGLGGRDGSLVVDMKKFRTLEVDLETNVAALGAGLRLGDVAVGLFEKGGRAMPHGLCPG
jgi:FAD/FMN-containing dehydrogenase